MPFETTTCTGASGRIYTLEVFPIGTVFKPRPGVYVFARSDEHRRWQPIYIGQTSNLDERLREHLTNHDNLTCIKAAKPTHLHVMTVLDERERQEIQQDIVRSLHPLCNAIEQVQPRRSGAL